MRPLVVCAVLSLCGSTAVPRGANAQIQHRVAVTPLVLDTVDVRLAVSLRDALARTQSHVKVSPMADLWATLEQGGSDTISRGSLRELAKLMRVNAIVGVHGCAGGKVCLLVFAEGLMWPSPPDTLRLQGPMWIQAATDTLARRFFPKPAGS